MKKVSGLIIQFKAVIHGYITVCYFMAPWSLLCGRSKVKLLVLQKIQLTHDIIFQLKK